MDATLFDRLTQSIGGGVSRRTMLRFAAAAMGLRAAPVLTTAKGKKEIGTPCAAADGCVRLTTVSGASFCGIAGETTGCTENARCESVRGPGSACFFGKCGNGIYAATRLGPSNVYVANQQSRHDYGGSAVHAKSEPTWHTTC